jgi:hypothetical protein
MTIDQISVFVENKPGKLVEIIEALGEAKVDLRALSIADTSDFGILRLIVDHPETAIEVLRQAECVVSVTQVIAVKVDDTPGGLAKVLRILSDAGISIEYIYAFVAHEEGRAFVILRVEDNEKAIQVLTEKDIKIAGKNEIYGL